MKPKVANVRLSLAGIAAAGLAVGPIGFLALVAMSISSAVPAPAHASVYDTPQGCQSVGGIWNPGGPGTGRASPGCDDPSKIRPIVQPPTVDPNNCASIQFAITWDEQQIAANSTNVGMQQSFIQSERALVRLLAICGRAGGGYTSNVTAGGSRQMQVLRNNLNTFSNALGVLADFQAQRQAAAQAAQDAQDQRDAIAAQQKAVADAISAAKDANMRNLTPDTSFGGPPANQSDTFDTAAPAAAAAGPPSTGDNDQPDEFEVAALNPPHPVGGAADSQAGSGGPAAMQDPPAAPTQPTRKLGEPAQADSLAPITSSACKAMKPHADIIDLPNGADYCVVEVDTPELTNEWHHLIDDPLRPSPHAPLPTLGVRG